MPEASLITYRAQNPLFQAAVGESGFSKVLYACGSCLWWRAVAKREAGHPTAFAPAMSWAGQTGENGARPLS